jgi:lipopolysaccharide export system protein LptA
VLAPPLAADAATARPRPAPTGTAPSNQDLMGQLSLGSSKDPILISADELDVDYQNNKVVYRGKVHATQGDLAIDSDTLTINFQRADAKAKDTAKGDAKDAAKGDAKDTAKGDAKDTAKGDAKAKDASPPAGSGSDKDLAKGKRPTLRDVVAQGNVVITQKTRRATGQVAVFSQTMRQLVLGGDPVLRDGPNEVTGDRIVVYLDEGRSVVESGGKKRVSAVLYPGSERGLGETAGKPAEKPSATGKKR